LASFRAPPLSPISDEPRPTVIGGGRLGLYASAAALCSATSKLIAAAHGTRTDDGSVVRSHGWVCSLAARDACPANWDNKELSFFVLCPVCPVLRPLHQLGRLSLKQVGLLRHPGLERHEARRPRSTGQGTAPDGAARSSDFLQLVPGAWVRSARLFVGWMDPGTWSGAVSRRSVA